MNRTKKLLIALLCTLSFAAIADTSDLYQEVKIKAPRQFADIKNKQVIYYGPVVVTQGSIRITANKLSASQKNGITTLIATGEPATYSQILENNRRANASAKEIRYNISKRIMTLTGHAAIEQDGSKVSAEKIVYDIEKQQMNAQGSQNPNDRVITIIKPENFQDEGKKLDSKASSAHHKKEQPSS